MFEVDEPIRDGAPGRRPVGAITDVPDQGTAASGPDGRLGVLLFTSSGWTRAGGGPVARIDHYRSSDAPAANSIVVAVTAFVRDVDGRLLLIRRSDNDLYAIPGGALELGETLTQAARREVLEETGIVVDVTGLVGVYSDPEHVIEFSDGEVRQEFSVCFRGVPVGGEPRTSDESKEVLWVAPDELGALSIHPSIRLRIRHGLEDRVEAYYS